MDDLEVDGVITLKSIIWRCYMEIIFMVLTSTLQKSDGLKNQGFPLLPVVALIEVVVGGGEY